LSERQLSALQQADYLTFTSSSTVRFFYQAAGDRIHTKARIVSIGPITSEALRERGIEPEVEASRHDLEGLLDALVQDATDRRGGGP
jgi:uroporphyrinogen III methyltransferase/synthase